MLQLLFVSLALANPYPDPRKVPLDKDYPPLPPFETPRNPEHVRDHAEKGGAVLRVTLTQKNEKYALAHAVKEYSGTPALFVRAHAASGRGSYRARLLDGAGNTLAYDDIGLGREFRRLVDGITFRFPLPSAPVTLSVQAENPDTGAMEPVLSQSLDPSTLPEAPQAHPGLEIRELKASAGKAPELRVNIYAEGYTADRAAAFWERAPMIVSAVLGEFPQAERLHFYGVFAPSHQKLGAAHDLGTPVPERDSFLSLYFPYWENFGRWTYVLYPSRETHYRDAISLAPYDYAIALVDDAEYWGVGNYRELTAVPAEHPSLVFLLTHEIGHYFGLNEEYEGGGRTELEFAPGITEPWSPNITFRASPVKWSSFVDRDTPLPTPDSYWSSEPPVYGAYAGGYGDSDPEHSHKPGHNCVMERYQHFCDVCKAALTKILKFDAGE
jgi:hypothetical protein